MLSWFRRKQDFCSQDLPREFHGFVDAFLDFVHADGPAAPPVKPEPIQTFLPAAARLVAIGDIHGDLCKARRAFRAGGLIDENDRWIGGTTTAVQVGDLLDRGDNEVAILYWLERLQQEAADAGGKLHILNGNHESLNVAGRFRYATPQGMQDFLRWQTVEKIGAGLKNQPAWTRSVGPLMADGSTIPSQRLHAVQARCGHDDLAARGGGWGYGPNPGIAARAAALRPGGSITRRFLAPHPTVLQIGSTLFVHGGILPEHAQYGLERINEETRQWMLGTSDGRMPDFLGGRSAVVWAREYSTEDAHKCDCNALRTALSMIPGAKRMVVGHTIQDQGINSACQEQVYRIDVGLSKGCGNGSPEVLEILDDGRIVRRLHEPRTVNEGPKAPDTPQPQPEAGGTLSDWWRGKQPQPVAAQA